MDIAPKRGRIAGMTRDERSNLWVGLLFCG
ncbi:MAG: hypothetical protein JWO42_605, partial [Chloroflexi bacterium]|nr:hypothetical protein [Chloroflexota bacterium]